ncbi:MAG: hypothetical protein RR303_06060 [Bacteroidales bacterium]
MKTILTMAFTSLSLCISLTSCNNEDKPYTLVYEGARAVTAILPEPDSENLKQGSLVFNGFSLDEIEQDIFNDLKNKEIEGWGSVTLYLQSEALKNGGNINHDELKGLDYEAYQGKITSQIEEFFFNNF